MTKRVSDMTAEQRQRKHEEARRYRELNANKIKAWAKKYRDSPLGRDATERARLKHYANPDAWRARMRAQQSARQARIEANPQLLAAYERKKAAAYAKNRDSLLRRNRERWHRKRGISANWAGQGLTVVMEAMPRNLPDQVRDDVLGDIMLALMDGTLKLDNLKAKIPEYIRAHNRQFDTFRNLSLDVAHPETGTAWVDNLSSDVDHF